MRYPLLTASVLSIIGMGLSHAVFANSTYCSPGFYAGVQGGGTNTGYTPNDLLYPAATNFNHGSLILLNNTAFAFPAQGIVVTGTNSENASTNTTLLAQEVENIALGGRVFLGYQLNPYFATEVGYTQYGKTSFSALGNVVTNDQVVSNTLTVFPRDFPAFNVDNSMTNTQTINNYLYNGDVTEHSADLVLKGTLPLRYGFGLYVKAGMAYITANRYINSSQLNGSSNTNTQDTTSDTDDDDNLVVATTASSNNTVETSHANNFVTIYEKTYQAVRPTYGVGADYTIPDSNFDVDASWTRVQGFGQIPNADLLALGVGYKFGGAISNMGTMPDTTVAPIPISTYCTSGLYAGIQGGGTDTHYSPAVLLAQAGADRGVNSHSVQVFPSTMDAFNDTFFETITTNTFSSTTLQNEQIQNINMGGRVFTGYQINHYIAAEAGFTQYGKTSFSGRSNTPTYINEVDTTNAFEGDFFLQSNTITTNTFSTDSVAYTGDVTENAFDLVLKGTLPLRYGFGIYAKGGAAYIATNRYINSIDQGGSSSFSAVNTLFNANAFPVPTTTITPLSSGSSANIPNQVETIYEKSYHAVRPTYGFGADYTIPGSNFDLDASWSRVQGAGAIPNADLLALGLGYKFA